MKLGYSMFSFSEKADLNNIFSQISKMNYDGVEPVLSEDGYLNPEMAKSEVLEIKKIADANGLEIPSVGVWSLWANNPVSNVKLPRQLRTVEELHRKNMKFYSKEEAKELFEYFNTVKRNKICALLAEFLYLTGLRFGEASGLQKEDIDFENMCLTVNHTLSRLNITNQFKLSSPKTASAYRTVYFNDRCKEILLEAFKHNKSEKYQSFVFVNSVQSLFDNGNFNDYLAKYALRSGIRPDLKPTSHVFRHSHISLLVEMGLPLKVIMQRVGHTDEKMTTQIYTHITSAMNNNYVEVIRGFDLTKI